MKGRRARLFKKYGTWYATCACGDHVTYDYSLPDAYDEAEKFYKRYACSDFLERKAKWTGK